MFMRRHVGALPLAIAVLVLASCAPTGEVGSPTPAQGGPTSASSTPTGVPSPTNTEEAADNGGPGGAGARDAGSSGQPTEPVPIPTPPDGNAGPGGTPVPGGNPTPGRTPDAGGVPAPGGGSSGTSGAILPDFTLWALPECDVAPQPSGTGLDVYVSVRNSGPGDWGHLVPVVMQSDTGLRFQAYSAISTGASVTVMQVALRPGDYSRVHRFVVKVDPDNTIAERDENNNSLVVNVPVPAAPIRSYTSVSCWLG